MNQKIENSSISNVRVIENNSKNHIGSPICKCNSCSKHHNHCVDVESIAFDNCTNTPVTPTGISSGVVVKIPVVLAELTLQFHVGANIHLPEPALEVRNIKKRLKITQCTLLQPTNILFIKGFVRKSIEYSTGVCSTKEGICGKIHHCTIDVPFECSTPVRFHTQPEELALNSSSEFQYFKVDDLPNKHFAEKDNLLSGDLSEFNQFMTENFNELPFCELIQAKIFEFDEFIDRKRPCHVDAPFEERFFNKIEEKMVIELTLKILQNRQVRVPGTSGSFPNPGPCSNAID